MKPAFALDLSQDGLALLYRLEDGWAALGSVGFDAPDLEARLAGLRARAEALAPGDVLTKLILPDSQILYTEVDAPGPDAASRRAQIAAALEGRTPYPVDDLAFDWSRSGGTVQVAVAARLTLAEAEDFAEAQGLNPVCFVARPEPGRFAGEPFFGLAARAADHLPEGARLDRDQDPVRIVALPPDLAIDIPAPPEAGEAEVDLDGIEPPAAEMAAVAAPEPAESNIPAAGAAEVPDVLAPQPAEPEPIAEPEPAAEPEPLTEPVAEAPFIAVDDPGDDTLDDDAPDGPDGPDGPEPAGEAGRPDGAPSPAAAFASRRRVGGGATDPATLLAEATGRLHLLADEPAAVARPAPRLGPAAADLAVTAPEIDVPPPGLGAETTDDGKPRGRGHGRAALTALPEARHGTQAQLRARQTRQTPPDAQPARRASGVPATAGRRAAPNRARLGLILVAALVLLMAAVALWSAWSGADPEPAATLPAPGATALAEAPGAAAPSEAAPETVAAIRPKPAPETDPPADVATEEPAAAETAATPAAAPAVRPKPAPATGLPSDAAAPDAVAPDAEPSADAVPEKPADAIDAALAEALAPEAGETTAGEATAAAPAAAPTDTAPATSAPATSAPAAADAPPVWTGVLQRAADPEDQSSGAATLAAAADPGRADLPEAPGTLSAGPVLAGADSAPETQPLPPPFGTVITFGPDGRIVPTPEGVITPDGFTLFAGRPPLVPATAPRADAVAIPPAPAGTATAGPELAPLPGPVDPAHAARKPKTRPEAVLERAAEAAAEAAAKAAAPAPAEPAPATPGAVPPAEIDGALPAPVDPAHAAQKPKAQPETVARRAEAARTEAATLAAAAEAAARAEAEALASASRLAVASSRRPSERPSGLAKAVEAAVAAAVAAPPAPEPEAPQAAPQAAPAPVVASAPAPVEIDEPEPTEAVPNMPTTVTVAKQATVKNAIDLGKMNLIGVYGSSSNRRALIRMPTGRLVKVKVGDRLDGGQVAAIGDSELTYVKGGRSYTLKILKNG